MGDIYWESQRGGLCRKHALGAYFGRPLINDDKFQQLCIEFDKYMRGKGYKNSQVEKFDCIYSSRETLISYVIGRYGGGCCLHIPMGECKAYLDSRNTTLLELIGEDDFVFVYNPNHIYGWKKTSAWYKVDSLSGISKISPVADNKLGYIIPRKCPLVDLKYNQDRIAQILNEGIADYLSHQDNLGDLEVLFATSAHIIGCIGGFSDLKHYYTFLRNFEDSYIIDKEKVEILAEFFAFYSLDAFP